MAPLAHPIMKAMPSAVWPASGRQMEPWWPCSGEGTEVTALEGLEAHLAVAAPLWRLPRPRAASPWLLEPLRWDCKSTLLPSQVLSV